MAFCDMDVSRTALDTIRVLGSHHARFRWRTASGHTKTQACFPFFEEATEPAPLAPLNGQIPARGSFGPIGLSYTSDLPGG